MVDWLLEAHRVAPLQFEMGGSWSPVSVRDQMVRGQELVRRAMAANLIDATRPLIIVGAGAGGVAAALTADAKQVPVTVIERERHPFGRQRGVTSRMIHPYVYDWPLDRAGQTAMGSPAVLPWGEGRADRVANRWATWLAAPLISYQSVVAAPAGSSLPAVALRAGSVFVHVVTSTGSGWLGGGMLLSSVGFGTELTSVPSVQGGTYDGWWFWENDTLDQAMLGHNTPPRVVIAGGGDGGLQDAMRALLDPAVHDVRQLVAALPPIPDELLAEIVDADDTATRALLWAGGADDCAIVAELHRRVVDAVDLWWQADDDDIRAALRPLWRTDVQSVDLVHGCTHFGRGYVLNRFLVLLLQRAAPEPAEREEPGWPSFTITAGHHLAHVDGGHPCSGRPCPGTHRAHFTKKDCTSAPTVSRFTRSAEIVIIRGGIAAPTSPLATSPVANRRQHLPDRPR